MTDDLREVINHLTVVDRFDICGEVWVLLRPKGSVLKDDFVHGGGTIRLDGEFARSMSIYFKERDAAMSQQSSAQLIAQKERSTK